MAACTSRRVASSAGSFWIADTFGNALRKLDLATHQVGTVATLLNRPLAVATLVPKMLPWPIATSSRHAASPVRGPTTTKWTTGHWFDHLRQKQRNFARIVHGLRVLQTTTLNARQRAVPMGAWRQAVESRREHAAHIFTRVRGDAFPPFALAGNGSSRGLRHASASFRESAGDGRSSRCRGDFTRRLSRGLPRSPRNPGSGGIGIPRRTRAMARPLVSHPDVSESLRDDHGPLS